MDVGGGEVEEKGLVGFLLFEPFDGFFAQGGADLFVMPVRSP